MNPFQWTALKDQQSNFCKEFNFGDLDVQEPELNAPALGHIEAILIKTFKNSENTNGN